MIERLELQPLFVFKLKAWLFLWPLQSKALQCLMKWPHMLFPIFLVYLCFMNYVRLIIVVVWEYFFVRNQCNLFPMYEFYPIILCYLRWTFNPTNELDSIRYCELFYTVKIVLWERCLALFDCLGVLYHLLVLWMLCTGCMDERLS